MTVSSENNKSTYPGDGATTEFSTGFTFDSDTEVTVTLVTDSTGAETPWTDGTQYTLIGAGTGNNGTLTVDTSPTDYTPASGETLVIELLPAFTQPTPLPRGGTVSPKDTLEPMHDSRVRQMLRLKDLVDRSLKAPITETGIGTIPSLANRKGKVLGFNATTGDPEPLTPNTDAYITMPASVVDNSVPRWDGTGGDALQDSTNVTITDTGNMEIGDPGFESGGMDIGGTTYATKLSVNDLGGTNPVQLAIHRHSTSLPAAIVGSRSNSADSTHGAVTAGMALFGQYSGGWTGAEYNLFTQINHAVDDTAGLTIDNTSSPGKIELMTTPDGATSPALAMTIFSDKRIEVEKGVLTNSGALGNLNSATTLHIKDGNMQDATMTGSFALTAPDDAQQGWIELDLTIDGTGGYTFTPSGFNEISGTVDTAAGVVNVLRVTKKVSATTLEITQHV